MKEIGFAYTIVKAAMNNVKEPLMITKSVREALFGYENKLFIRLRGMIPPKTQKRFPRLVPPPLFGILYDVSN
jgi:hypothetical protein